MHKFLAPPEPVSQPSINPCVPSPCGPNSQCREIGSYPSCSCLEGYIGTPPNCRPECSINSECSSNLACIREKCRDPCPGSCGANAVCNVINHTPSCSCPEGYTGDSFSYCIPKPIISKFMTRTNRIRFSNYIIAAKPQVVDKCNPSPCGQNTVCNNGVCTCLSEYQGNPLVGCRPECVLNNDCPRNKACVRNKCVDPCIGVCGLNADCTVINHVPTCSCVQGFIGNAFVQCNREPGRLVNFLISLHW